MYLLVIPARLVMQRLPWLDVTTSLLPSFQARRCLSGAQYQCRQPLLHQPKEDREGGHVLAMLVWRDEVHSKETLSKLIAERDLSRTQEEQVPPLVDWEGEEQLQLRVGGEEGKLAQLGKGDKQLAQLGKGDKHLPQLGEGDKQPPQLVV